MKKRFLALLLAIVSIFCLIFASCGDKTGGKSVDYAAQLKLDMSSKTAKTETTVIRHIDGDTTHFNVPTSIVATGTLKARYLAVNTPESTGKIEEWGKKASKYTESKLLSATSIILESNDEKWNVDSTGERHLVWVWYKSAEMTDYRCLNIELLQEGLAVGSSPSETCYGTVCNKAIDQATRLKLHVYSDEIDPDYWYGDAVELDLRELCLNKESYLGQKVAFYAVVTQSYGDGSYIEAYDEETQQSYGMYIFYGGGSALTSSPIKKLSTPGTYVRIVGILGNQFGWQISDMSYDSFTPKDPNKIQFPSKELMDVPCTIITAEQYNNQEYTVTWQEETEDGEIETKSKTAPYLEIAMNTRVSMQNLYVSYVSTTNNGGDNDGAMTLHCTSNGTEVIIRTTVFQDADGNTITGDAYKGKTISVTGNVTLFDYNDIFQYQLKVFSPNDIVIH